MFGKEHFDLIAVTYDRRARRGLWGQLKLKEMSAVLKQIDKPKKVLDLGCGTGMYAEKIRESFPQCQIFGLDKSVPMLQKFEERGFAGAKIDFNQRSFSKGPFDLILSLGVLEFVSDLRFVKETMRSSSEKGTRLLVLVPRLNILNMFYFLYHRFHGTKIKLRRTCEYKKIFYEEGFEMKAELQVTPVSRLLIFQKL